nr:hypothetical protein [Tanacetum cinerariifolium]
RCGIPNRCVLCSSGGSWSREDVCVGGTSGGGVTGGGGGGGTSFATVAQAAAVSVPSLLVGTTNMGANIGICGPS